METRKIQTVGSGTYTVSLPKEWAHAHDLDAGEPVTLHTHVDGVLVVQAGERSDHGPVRVFVCVDHDDTAPLERTIRAAYAAGSSVVTFVASDGFTEAQRRAVEAAVRTLAGVSIDRDTETTITVRTLLDSDEISVRQTVRQIEFVALSMHRDATAALSGDRNAGALDGREEHVARLNAITDRSFARALSRLDEVDALGSTRPELFELWVTGRELERVAVHARSIADLSGRIDVSTDESAELAEIASEARDIVEAGVSVLLDDAGVDTAHRALIARDRLAQTCATLEDRLLEPTDEADLTADLAPLALVLDRVRRTADHGETIADLGLRRAIRRGDLADSPEQEGESPVEPSS